MLRERTAALRLRLEVERMRRECGASARRAALKLKTYQAWTMAEALAFVKKDLGVDAVILHTRTFERGGFFGFGRRAVVEITAARAADMPATDAATAARSTRTKGAATPRVTTNAHRAPDRAPDRVLDRAPEGGAARPVETVRFSAAARAYGSQTAPGTSATTSTSALPLNTPLASAAQAAVDVSPIDMNAEREKTRRLAQSMAIQLEKQATTRSMAARNERATGEAAATVAANFAPVSMPSATATGPAQRFVLVPEQSGAGFTGKLTAAVVRELPATAVGSVTPALSTSRPEPLLSVASVASVAERARAVPTLATELDTISAFVGRVLAGNSSATPAPNLGAAPTIPATTRDARPASLESAYARLIEQEVAAELADRILRDVAREFDSAIDAGIAPSEAAVRESIERRIAALLPSDDTDAFRILPGRNGGARRIAFVGPTGVGKTTTLAKIAAQLALKRGLRVGIVAADTYRIAAVDQLRTYAEILGIPVEVASSPADASRACERLGDVDVILIDTAGRSQNDRMKLSELRAFLAAAEPDETHLVLSATAGARTLAREVEAFGALGIDRLALTKLDEAASFGTLVSLVERLGTRVSFLTHGQEVPDHIEVARGRRLAALVMGSEVR